MAGKQPTQAMPDGVREGAADGTNGPEESRRAQIERREQAEKGEGPRNGFRGGQSVSAYHGSHQLGEQAIDGKGDPNATRKSG